MPRLRDLTYPVAYLLAVSLLFGLAYLYLAGRAGPPRVRLAASVPPGATAATVAAAPRSDGTIDPAAAFADGPRIQLERDRFAAGTPDTLRLRVLDAHGTALSTDRGVHRVLRLAVVRRDLKDFRPLSAVPGPGGTWSAPILLPSPGPYRLLAELRTGGREPLILGADLLAPGAYRSAVVPPPAVEANAWPYAVTLDGAVRAGEGSRLTFSVLRDGDPIDLTPGQDTGVEVTVLRLGDLAPARIVAPARLVGPGAGHDFEVDLVCVRAGTYRLFLSFRDAHDTPASADHDVHTAEFTLPVAA